MEQPLTARSHTGPNLQGRFPSGGLRRSMDDRVELTCACLRPDRAARAPRFRRGRPPSRQTVPWRSDRRRLCPSA